MKGAITVFMTLLFGMILSLVLVTIENVRFLTGESYARLSAKGALHAAVSYTHLTLPTILLV